MEAPIDLCKVADNKREMIKNVGKHALNSQANYIHF
jgi:hypothetical protein